MISLEQLNAITAQHLQILRETRPPETLEDDCARWAFLVSNVELQVLVNELKKLPRFAHMTAEEEQRLRAGITPIVLPSGVGVLPEYDLLQSALASAVAH